MKDSFKFALTLLASNMIALTLLALAAYLIHLDRDGWGWCVIAAFCCGYGPKTKPDEAAAPPTKQEETPAR